MRATRPDAGGIAGFVQRARHLGNRGLLVSGAVQWMTAGRGIIHPEMPQQEKGRMRGFQLRPRRITPRWPVFEGELELGGQPVGRGRLAALGDVLDLRGGAAAGGRALVLAAKPLREPIK